MITRRIKRLSLIKLLYCLNYSRKRLTVIDIAFLTGLTQGYVWPTCLKLCRMWYKQRHSAKLLTRRKSLNSRGHLRYIYKSRPRAKSRLEWYQEHYSELCELAFKELCELGRMRHLGFRIEAIK